MELIWFIGQQEPCEKLRPKTKQPTADKGRTNLTYQVDFKDCENQYTERTGKKLSMLIYDHKLAAKQHGPISLTSVHEARESHRYNFENVRMVN